MPDSRPEVRRRAPASLAARAAFPEARTEKAAPVPQHDGILDAFGQRLRRHELQIHVEERWAVETDEEPRLTDVLSGERGEERAEACRDPLPLVQHRGPRFGLGHHHEIEIRVHVHAPIGEGSARGDAREAGTCAEEGQGIPEEGAVGCRCEGPVVFSRQRLVHGSSSAVDGCSPRRCGHPSVVDPFRALAVAAVIAASLLGPAADARADDTFSAEEILERATGFFGESSEGLAKAVEEAFREQGRPNGYIVGDEGGGAFVVGLRYGQGVLERKSGARRFVYWNGPSIGWDVGGSASRVFMLVYALPSEDAIFQRFPGVEGSLYLVAGVGMNYLQSGPIVLAPIRTGVGLRAGLSAGYLSFTPRRSWIPF